MDPHHFDQEGYDYYNDYSYHLEIKLFIGIEST